MKSLFAVVDPRRLWCRWKFSCALLILIGLPYQHDAKAQSVCASETFSLSESAVGTRQAFEASLAIVNSSDSSLTQIRVTIQIKDGQGNDETSNFFVGSPLLQGISAVDGTGVVNSGINGTSIWTLIPGVTLAQSGPQVYYFQGTLQYTVNGESVSIPLSPVGVTVYPSAQLSLKYFLQRDVLGDDPFTAQIEPSVPFNLVMMIQNFGTGTAQNLQVTSGEPQIVDNVKGLLNSFAIVGTLVNGQSGTPSLTVNFGNVNPGQIVFGRWLFTSSLQGLFINYSATFQSDSAYGGNAFSLFRDISIHEMIHLVDAAGIFEDGKPDFLVKDLQGQNDLPDTLYLSQGTTNPVQVLQQASIDAPVSASHLTVQLTVPLPSAWSYLEIPDPANGNFNLVGVQRSDGTNISVNTNAWITAWTFPGAGLPAINTNILHLLDYNSTGAYTLIYTPLPPPNTNLPTSTVAALPTYSLPNFAVSWSGTDGTNGSGIVNYNIYVSDNGGSFSPWLQNTILTSVIYPGQLGHTYAFYSIATDTAGNQQATPLQPQAQTTVSLTNSPPVLSVVSNVTISAGQTLSLMVSASDPNPLETLAFSAGPGTAAGAVVNPATGQITWPTSPLLGGTTNVITVIVTDHDQPPLSATGMVTVIVQQTINPPVLAPIPNYTNDEATLLIFTNSATDNNFPPRPLICSLGAGAPTNATIDPVTGIFQWRPTAAQAPSTNVITVIVTDNGSPPLSASQQFTVIVNPVTYEFVLSFGFTNLLVGQSNSVPVALDTQLQLTNITVLLQASAASLTNLSLSPTSPEIVATLIQPLGSNEYSVTLTLNPSLRPGNPTTLAELGFLAVPQIHSSIVPLEVSQPAGLETDGQFAAKPGSANGRVIIVGLEPVLDASLGTNPTPVFTIYGNLGSIYQMAFTTNLASTNWTITGNILITNQQQGFNVNQTALQIYYRTQ